MMVNIIIKFCFISSDLKIKMVETKNKKQLKHYWSGT